MNYLYRCTRFRFGPLQENQIVPRLEHVATTENVNVTEDGKKALIALSGGDMRKVRANNIYDRQSGCSVSIDASHLIYGCL